MSYSFKREQSDIKAQIYCIEAIGEIFAKSGSFISSTEVGGLMNNLVLASRRLEDHIGRIERKQNKTLLNIIPFNLRETRKIIRDLLYNVQDALATDLKDSNSEDVRDWGEVISMENNEPAFSLYDSSEEVESIRWHLIKNIKVNYTRFTDLIKSINRHLDSIEEYNHHLDDVEISGKIYSKMLEDYQREEWEMHRESLIIQTRNRIRDFQENGRSEDEALQRELDSLKVFYINDNQQRSLRRLFKTVVDETLNPVEVIIDLRDELTDDDISNYFTFLFKYRTLKTHIDSNNLLKPEDTEYSRLFTSCASKKYIDILCPIISKAGGIIKKQHFGILYLVMHDLGLVKKTSKSNIQMMQYANTNLMSMESLRMSDQSMIRITLSKNREQCFGKLEYKSTQGTKFKQNEIKPLQDVYWRLFTILNSGLVRPEEHVFADYLREPHPNVDLDKLLSEQLSDIEQQRLSYLRSVLRKETLMFDEI